MRSQAKAFIHAAREMRLVAIAIALGGAGSLCLDLGLRVGDLLGLGLDLCALLLGDFCVGLGGGDRLVPGRCLTNQQ